MKVQINDIDNDRKEVIIEETGDVLNQKYESIYKRISIEAKVPGFRPGKAPRELVEKHYSGVIRDELVRELVPQLCQQAFKEHNLDVFEITKVSDVNLTAFSLSFRAQVEIAPKIELNEYKGISIEYEPLKVTDEEIERVLDSTKESFKVSELTDESVRALGYPNISEFRKTIEAQLLLRKAEIQINRIEKMVIKKIAKNFDFKVPYSLIQRYLEGLLQRAKMDLLLRGVREEEITKFEPQMRKELEEKAKEEVRIHLLLLEVAKRENFSEEESNPKRVMEFLLRQAKWQEKK